MLDKRDMLLALMLHVGVIALLVWMGLWQERRATIAPKHVMQVSMVSLDELRAMMPKASKPKPQLSKPKHVSRAKPKAADKPKAQRHKAKPKATSKIKEPDFDPFAPLESQAGSKPVTRNQEDTRQALSTMLRGQLSQQELNRYIVGMQRAVERQWKVPMEMLSKVKPALVELTLSPKGEVLKIVILESSGSTKLDTTLKKAIYAAAPFDVPQKQFDLFRVNRIRFHPLQ